MSRTFLSGTSPRGSGPPGCRGFVAAAGGESEGLVRAANVIKEVGLVDQKLGNAVDIRPVPKGRSKFRSVDSVPVKRLLGADGRLTGGKPQLLLGIGGSLADFPQLTMLAMRCARDRALISLAEKV